MGAKNAKTYEDLFCISQTKNPKEMDLKKYLDYARNEMKNFYVKKINSVFKTK